MAAPAYSAEIAETKYRGALGSLMQVMVCLGMLFVNINCSTNWRGNSEHIRLLSSLVYSSLYLNRIEK